MKKIALLYVLLTLLLTACNTFDAESPVSSSQSEAELISEVSPEGSIDALTEEQKAQVDSLLNELIEQFNNKQYTKGIATAEQLIETDDTIMEAYGYMGLCYTYLHRQDEAMSAMKQMVTLFPGSGQAAYWQGYCYKYYGNPSKAVEWFDVAVSLDNTQTWAYYGTATIFADRRETDKALDYLQEAIRCDASVKELAKSQRNLHWDKFWDNPRFIQLTSNA